MTVSLTELQLSIMKVVWEHEKVGVVDLHDVLRAERRIAQSTVATLLARMEKKGLVGRLFEGDVAEMVSHLLRENDVAADDLTRLKQMIEQREAELKEGGR